VGVCRRAAVSNKNVGQDTCGHSPEYLLRIHLAVRLCGWIQWQWACLEYLQLTFNSIAVKLTPSPPSHHLGVREISLDHKDRIPESSMENERPTTRSSIVASMTCLRLLAFGAHADLNCIRLGLDHFRKFQKVLQCEMAMKYFEVSEI
jgi:hypothetical protein